MKSLEDEMFLFFLFEVLFSVLVFALWTFIVHPMFAHPFLCVDVLHFSLVIVDDKLYININIYKNPTFQVPSVVYFSGARGQPLALRGVLVPCSPWPRRDSTDGAATGEPRAEVRGQGRDPKCSNEKISTTFDVFQCTFPRIPRII